MGDAEWTVERHLSGKPPEIVALYQRFIALAEVCGPFTYSVTKSAITLKGARRGFAGARPGNRALGGYLDLQGRVDDPRIVRSSPYTGRLYVHQFRIRSSGELDDEFAGWIHDAYQVGGGAHLSRPPRATLARRSASRAGAGFKQIADPWQWRWPDRARTRSCSSTSSSTSRRTPWCT